MSFAGHLPTKHFDLAEWQAMPVWVPKDAGDVRSMRRVFAARIARKLAAPLYGNMISVSEAKNLILEAGR